MDENLRYIDSHFIARTDLLARTGIDDGQLQALVDQRLIPRASYFPDENGWIRSNLGGVPIAIDDAYFHPSLISHIHEVRSLLAAGADCEQLAEERRTAFCASYACRVRSMHALGLLEQEIREKHFADPDALAAVANTEYEHWLAGTYGLCTRENTPEAVAIKECTVRNIDHLAQGEELRGDARERLVRYIRLYDSVAAFFAPFERKGSSRYRLCTVIPERYGLDMDSGTATRNDA